MADEVELERDVILPQTGAEPDRRAQPVDAEQPPRLPFPVVGVGASAGGIEAFSGFLNAMRPDGGIAFVFVLHLPPDRESHLPEILGRRTAMPVRQVEDGMPVEVDHVYVIRPGHVVTVRDGRLHLGPELGGPRAANRPVDDLFRSLAAEQRERAICVVMSGMGSNGTAGAQAVKAVGGLCVAQSPETTQFPSMPTHLIQAGYADYVLAPADMPEVLLGYAGHPYAKGDREADAGEFVRRERQHLRDILAVLRARTRHDFTGYKTPTVLRRVQRRMGLTRTGTVGEYARLLRGSPAEATALGDDLLIHVTGFFRDPDAWEALRRHVVAPLVAAREDGGAVRAWVTACSTGEEAYSLAMLLVEEAERAGKPLDVKVFATDLADRALAHARAGVYPGGIESEVSPDRLARFFARDDEQYRVRPDLRDRVVFAAQNVLQDPPFSRIDVASCRNLLIYLEPEVQQRVLRLLHFGLREGGALFLGGAETAAGADDLFEPVDKKARIFRRVGTSPPGAVEFPLPRAFPLGDPRPASAVPRTRADRPRPSVAQLAHRTLLEAHTPAAAMVDRDGHILYLHGDTGPFLQLPAGEPTRDLLLMAREGVRGAVRVALHRAAAQNGTAAVPDGWVEVEPGRRSRVTVTASPVRPDADTGGRAGAAAHFVVSFAQGSESSPAPAVPPADGAGESAAELLRLRAELQATVEELRTRNEDLKASNEEMQSLNEEMQSANEELETSKEEMQSLNEELTTVNAQLRGKMEEHQAASGDLNSLLTSTDIAVLFLDTTFRIRRFTPAARDLIDLIPGDIGRPVSALARKFDDPHLDDDCRAVLERLVPIEKAVAGVDGRHFQRRVTPYRTADSRIDGVVVTFVDVTDRHAAAEALAAEKEYTASIVDTLHEPLLVLHPDLTVRGANPAFYAHFRVDPAATLGRKVFHLGNGQWDIPALRTLLEDVLPSSNVFNDYEVTHDFEGLGRRAMLVNARRLDHVQLILLGVRDITDLREAEAVVRASEERLRLAVAAGELATWDWDVRTGRVEWNDAHFAMQGYTPGEVVPSYEAWMARVHPDDRPAAEAALATARDARTAYRHDFRVVRPDGGVRWLAAQGTFFYDRAGAVRMIGVMRDVTAQHEAQDALRRSEERLRLALAAARMGTWAWDPAGDAHRRDASLNLLLGLPAEETTSPLADFLSHMHPDDREPVRAAFDRSVRQGRPLNTEFRAVWPDGTVRWLRDQGDVFGTAGQPRLIGACVDVTDLKEAEAALRDARDRLEERVTERTADLGRAMDALEAEMDRRRELGRQLGTAQEDERRRVARDLHDTVGQLMAGLSLGFKAIETSGELPPPAKARLAEAQRIMSDLGRELHSLAVRLRPTSLDDIGLESALGQLVSEWSARTGVRADFHASGVEPGRLPPEVETAVYRVVQEALTNVVKHARATVVSVVVTRPDGFVSIAAEDNGVGFDPATTPKGRLGLLGMRERVENVGGEIDIESSPGAGTTVLVQIPIPKGGAS